MVENMNAIPAPRTARIDGDENGSAEYASEVVHSSPGKQGEEYKYLHQPIKALILLAEHSKSRRTGLCSHQAQ